MTGFKNIFKSHHPLRHAKSFKYAANGIFHALLNEANFRVQLVIVVFSVFLGFHYHISPIEWSLLTLTMGWLLSAELLNTFVEEFIDYFFKEESDAARVIKDVAAGFVLMTAISTFIILLLIFLPKLFIF